jgi:dipeptidyl aminopeptidase/acylaminoacyl peptidase
MSILMRPYVAALFVFIAIAPSPSRAELPPIIPREILFGNPDKINPMISPDGKHLAYIAPDKKNILQVWVRSVGQQDDRVITADKKRGIRQAFWAFDGEHLCYLQDTDGDENFQLYAVSLKSNLVRNLTAYQGVRCTPMGANPDRPDELLVSLNAKNRAKFDVYRLSLKTGALELDTENSGMVLGYVADAESRVRAGVQARLDGGFDLLYRDDPKQPWKTIRTWPAEEQGQPVGFSKDGKTLYVVANHDANTSRLTQIDLSTMKESVVAEDPEYDVGGAMVHPVSRVIQAVSVARAKEDWIILDATIKDDFAKLATIRKGEIDVISRDLADKTWLVSYTNDDGPIWYYTYDRASKKADVLFSHNSKLEGLKLAEMKPIEYKAKDGLPIHGYLSLPVGVEHKNLSTVLLVHGGPWARDSWGYNSYVQWLTNRGYAVLQVNFRGSTGYGKQFLNAGNREWAGKMHQDLIDGVDWLVKQGIADPKKIGIMGGSYGGYATLVGLTFTPDTFACGVDIVGPSNIISLLQTIPPYWAPMKAMFAKRVGDIEKEESFLKSRSPLFYVDRIRVPLMIAQGANDPRVKQSESDQIVEALRKAGKPVEYLVYTDEGHGFARPENRLHFHAKAEEFLAKYLYGRFEPAREMKGHAGEVR